VPLTDPDGKPLSLEDVFADPRAARLSDAMHTVITPEV
jgi:4-alpha-glucanotransferase